MKAYDIDVTKEMVTTLRVLVPDDLDPEKLYHAVYGPDLRRLADTATSDYEWDDYDRTVSVVGVNQVEDDGEFTATNITELLAAADRRLADQRAEFEKRRAEGAA